MSRRAKQAAPTPATNISPGWLLMAGAAICALSAFMLWRILARPDTYLLLPEGGAQWIRHDTPPSLVLGNPDDLTTWFRTRFRATAPTGGPPHSGPLYLRAFRQASVTLDGVEIFATPDDKTLWKNRYEIDTGAAADGGEHELMIKVSNYFAPPCLLVYAPNLGIVTNGTWEASTDGQTWTKSRLASDPRLPDVASQFPRADRMFIAYLPLFALVFAAAFAGYFVLRTPTYADLLTPPRARNLLLAAIGLLFLNNLFRLPGDLGFDIKGHFEYIQYIADNWRVPLPKEGWTMFQAPLFYIISAPILGMGRHILSFEQLMDALRIVPMICGAAQIEICYRIARIVFPERGDLQICATAFGALAPMNLYMSQYPGNESLCACLSGMALVMAFDAVNRPNDVLTRKRLCVLGVVYGLALLAKVSALVLGPPLALMLGHALLQSHPAKGRLARAGTLYATVFGTALLVSGWYFARNWIVQGRPFFGGWEPERGIPWWQDPGYRTPNQFFSFGESLVYPVYSMMWSFWDGFYATFWMDASLGGAVRAADAPPWNYSVLLAGMGWALIPTLAIAIGFARACAKPSASLRTGQLFAAVIIVLYLAATLHHFLDIPYYSSVKASYTMAALPCYALLLASGLEWFTRHGFVRPVAYALFACWAFSSYAGFFSV